jgi:hypothetical protein
LAFRFPSIMEFVSLFPVVLYRNNRVVCREGGEMTEGGKAIIDLPGPGPKSRGHDEVNVGGGVGSGTPE